jgi:HAD superfamily hydrolase (TIGR01509 family)
LTGSEPARAVPARAVIFDLDGVILDSEHVWEQVMHELFAAHGLRFADLDQDSFMGGDNSRQWAEYLRRVGGIPLMEDEILKWVTDRLIFHYTQALPLVPGTLEAVACLAASYRLGLASSSPRKIIAFVLENSGLQRFFTAWASSDDVPRGKPAPDVYRKACGLIETDPACCVAVEDSRVGIRAARSAGLRVIAIPHPSFPLDAASLELVDLTVTSIRDLDVATIDLVFRSCPDRPVC